ncbi:hypothetical protein MNB_SM-6-1097 [hydrothermal vent metagenome]|uniref:Uncharacterized protein n=1 Tax=hydrothermal vent metagenome TaxID=652676 RepID=A0A1W1BTH5_9ZZZZ
MWLAWALRVVLCSLGLAVFFALVITAVLYLKQGMPSLNAEVQAALLELFSFWFFLSLNIAVLVALFRSVKYLFNRSYAGYMLRFKRCLHKEDEHSREYIDPVGYGDLVKVWRKWFMLLIWIVGSFMILALIITYLFTPYKALFDWFNVYVLYAFILAGGYLSFLFLPARCKSMRIVKC